MFIYKITNLINNCLYIGQTIKDPQIRWKQHINLSKRASVRPLYVDMNKYGIASFKFEVVDFANNLEDLNKKEMAWAHHFNSFVPNGYNTADYQQTRYHLTEKQKKVKSANAVRQMTNKTKTERVKLAKFARSCWTEESKQKMKETKAELRRLGLHKKSFSRTEEHKKKLSQAMSSKYYIKSPDGYIYFVKNLKDFCLEKQLVRPSIAKVLVGSRNSCYGWTKSSKQEYLQQQKNPLNLISEIGEL